MGRVGNTDHIGEPASPPSSGEDERETGQGGDAGQLAQNEGRCIRGLEQENKGQECRTGGKGRSLEGKVEEE